MGQVYPEIDDTLRGWIARQPMFFVATAPDGPDGHINLSPKGAMDSFQVLGPTTVAYIDMYGSGIETVAHLHQNGRIVIMFCAFSGPPKIVRLHGHGRVITADEPEFTSLVSGFLANPEVRRLARTIVYVEISRISDSCGFTVPRMDVVAERDQLFRWAEQRQKKDGDDWATEYARAKNAESIDGLAGLIGET